MSSRVPLLLLVLAASAPLIAQTRLEVGVSIGQQSYASSADDPRVLTGMDFLAAGNTFGAHVAGEYADLSEEGALVAVHVDGVYRREWASGFSFLAGAGPSIISIGSSSLSWNAELEVARRLGRWSILARLRQYDFDLPRDREGEAGPAGPAVYVGTRIALRR
jgi:hypothetical protein